MEHTAQTEQKKPGEHVVLLRIEAVLWDEATTLWCWDAVIQWNGMAMIVVLEYGVNEIPRIGIE